MARVKMNVILITGLPGVGKTTIVKQLTEDLDKHFVNFEGFYTEEVRDAAGSRSGFDIMTFDGQRSPLARIGGNCSDTSKLPKVGRYSVLVSNFETLALPIFAASTDALVIDEIGKMELLSNQFESAIAEYIKRLEDKNNPKYLIATIPSRGHFPIVEKLKAIKAVKTFTITKQNRTSIYNNILQNALKMTKAETKNKK